MVECLISKQKVLGSVLSSKGVRVGLAKGKAGRIDLGTSLLRKISPQCSLFKTQMALSQAQRVWSQQLGQFAVSVSHTGAV